MDIKIIASGSSGNCYRVSDGVTSVLLDCGIPFKQIQKALNFELSSIDGVLVTHCHQDHVKSARELARIGIDVYTSKGTLTACTLDGGRFKAIESMDTFNVGTFTVMVFDVEHDVPEPLGFLLKSNVTGEKLLYFTDTYYLKYTFKGLNYIMGECNYSIKTLNEDLNPTLRDRILESHMSLEHFVGFLQANDLSELKEIYLLHLSNDNSDEDLFKKTVQKITGIEVYVC
jgi:phosphoribosyl 1,2-cyclic phosphodiesterase